VIAYRLRKALTVIVSGLFKCKVDEVWIDDDTGAGITLRITCGGTSIGGVREADVVRLVLMMRGCIRGKGGRAELWQRIGSELFLVLSVEAR
jgi:hypothetical protein